MTIAAAFNCPEGLVLCADSQETVGDFLKRSEPKIVVKANGCLESGEIDEPRAVFACAGDGPFIDMTVEKLWRQMGRTRPTHGDMIDAMEDELIRIHQRYWPLYPERERPMLQMLVGLYAPEDSPTLWKVDGPIVTEVKTYDCIGYGLSLGKYIGDRLFTTKMETSEAALLAIYLLEQAKNAVQYCGGESHVIMMPLPGWICRLSQDRVNKAVTAFAKFEEQSNRLLLKALEFELGEPEMLKVWADFYDGLPALRQELNSILKRVETFKQSTSQKSTD
ncbi:MAG: hypothetical protein WCA19_03965 [Candidatus Acidiferrales bacterium]